MKEDIFRAKLAADEGILGLFESDADTSYDLAHDLRAKIRELRAQLKALDAAYKVYRGFDKMGLEDKGQIAEATYEAALKEAEAGNNSIAVKLLIDSSKNGYVEAKLEYAKALIYGKHGVKRDPGAGLQLIEEAVEEVSPEACLLLTQIHEDYPDLVGPDVALEMCQRAANLAYEPAIKRLQQPFDMSEETKRLLERASRGEKGVHFWLSTRGDLLFKEREEHFIAAVKEEDPMAEYEMAETLLRKGDKKGAKEYYQKAMDHGNGPACFALAKLILNGKPHFYAGPKAPKKDDPTYQKELKIVERAAEIGDNRGLCVLGRAYARGYMVDANVDKAKELLEKAYNQGERDAAPQMLAEIYESSAEPGSAEKAVRYYEEASTRGNDSATLALARIYENGLREIEKNPGKASTYRMFVEGVHR